MSFVLPLVVLISATGLLALLHLLRSAPEGYEDNSGFHFINREEAVAARSRALVPVESEHQPARF